MRFLTSLLLVLPVVAYPAQQHKEQRYPTFTSRVSSYLDRILHGSTPIDQAKLCTKGARTSPAKSKHSEDVVLRFNISSEEEARALNAAVKTLILDVWEANKEWADIRIAKDMVSSLQGLLPNSMQNAHTIVIDDLAQAIFESRSSSKINATRTSGVRGTQREFGRPPQNRPDETSIFFGDYQPLSVITPWMRLIQSLYPTHVSIINIGSSYEGRSILGFKVGVHPTNSEQPAQKRKTVLITGGSHAREWISVSSVLYAAFSLIIQYGKSKQMTKYIEEFDWVFVPTINPDGYARTWDHDRLWRKNTQETNVRFCQGYDLDRSFAFEWDGDSTQGNPCSESFAGELPFQAVEALRLANWVTNETVNNNADIVSFLDLHSYSQQILYPYAFSCIQTPPSLENLEEIGLGLAKAIHQRSGEFYGVTSACEGNVAIDEKTKADRATWPSVESNGGTALDWMYHEAGTKYAFQIKLPDTGSHGFLLPRKYIVPTGDDVFAAVSYLGNYLLSNKGVESVKTTGSAKPKFTESKLSVLRPDSSVIRQQTFKNAKLDLR